MERKIIELNLDPEDKGVHSLTDKELNKAFKLISERARQGLADEDDIAFIKARREYLTDVVLVNITGLTFEEIENESKVNVEEIENESKVNVEEKAKTKAELKAEEKAKTEAELKA